MARSSVDSTTFDFTITGPFEDVGFLSFTWKSAVTVGGSSSRARLLHQVIRGRPVAVAVEEAADDPAVHHTVPGLVVRLGLEASRR